MADALTTCAAAARGISTIPFWWEDAPPEPSPDPLPETTDVVVVGGGFTGLNAAIALRRGGMDVTVLEATDFGRGASTRNAGHVSSGVNLGKGSSSAVRSPMERTLAPDLLAAVRAEAAASFDFLEARVGELPLDAFYRRSGRFVGAVSQRHFDGLGEKAERLGGHLVSRADQTREIGSTAYRGGMVIPRSGQLHPARYLHGLVALARAEGAALVSGAAAESIERKGAALVIRTARGPIRCKDVLIATNGYTGMLLPWLRRRVIPAASYIVVTEPLPAGLMDRLLPERRTYADTRRLLNYFRPTPDGRRLLFGGRATLRQREPASVAEDLRARLVAIFPELDAVPISHAWTGTIAFTFDFMPHLGRRDGIAYALGCNGSGVAMLSYLGHRAGEAMLRRPPSAFWNLDFPTAPLYRQTPWFLPLMSGYQRVRDWLDTRQG